MAAARQCWHAGPPGCAAAPCTAEQQPTKPLSSPAWYQPKVCISTAGSCSCPKGTGCCCCSQQHRGCRRSWCCWSCCWPQAVLHVCGACMCDRGAVQHTAGVCCWTGGQEGGGSNTRVWCDLQVNGGQEGCMWFCPALQNWCCTSCAADTYACRWMFWYVYMSIVTA